MQLNIAIIDARSPKQAIERLSQEFEICLFNTNNITYDALSGHPDVFIHQIDNTFILAPNIPQEYIDVFNQNNIPFSFGTTLVGKTIESSTQYNCLANSHYIFHKKNSTDSSIIKHAEHKKFISLPQAYTRCNMIGITDTAFITSDKGIEKKLQDHSFDYCYVDPSNILLPPYSHGCFGGCCGIFKNKIYIIGSLQHLENKKEITHFIQKQGLEVVELYDGQLYDGGGIFFLHLHT